MKKHGIMIATLLFALRAMTATADSALPEINGGIIVCLGCGDGAKIAELAAGNAYVHGLDTSAANIDKTRALLQAQKLYDKVAVARFDGKHLPYNDNTINCIVADSLGEVSQVEAMRVLAPLGTLLVGDTKTVKPWPKEMGDWPQYLNKADNNAVSTDTLVGPPRHFQWIDNPMWLRSHMNIPTVANMITGNGRLFTIEDTMTPENPFLPSTFYLVARDAFNGRTLWRQKINQWENETVYIKAQPVQQQHRMALAGDILYCTLQLEGPISALDAATGKILKTFKDMAPVQEIAYDQGILFLNVGDRFPSDAYQKNEELGKASAGEEGSVPGAPFIGNGWVEGYAPEIKDKKNPISSIVALDPKTGAKIWAIEKIDTYTGASLSIKGNHAVYQTKDGLFCVNSRTGKSVWAKKKKVINGIGHGTTMPGTTPNTVVLADDYVFEVEADSEAGGLCVRSTLWAYELKTGKELWKTPIEGGYSSPADVFYVKGSVWVCGGRNNPRKLDPATGKVIKTLDQQMDGPMGHDRCYRNFITERYFIDSKTGGTDFVDLESGTELPNYWNRSGCGSGYLPANGLLYTTPYSCWCSQEVMLPGLKAIASTKIPLGKSDQAIPVARKPRLEKGPAYNQIKDVRASAKDDWPCYRQDNARGAVNPEPVPGDLKALWTAQLPTGGSAVSIAAGKVFVSDIETHTMFAFDETIGKQLWTFTADGRVDSPPTYFKGMVLFGSRDGWVYCLRAADGVLAWRFKDLPDQLMGAYEKLESVWPVPGSVMILNDTLYFAAGRSSYLDGGIFVYKLNPVTGEVITSRGCYGSFDPETGFAGSGKKGDTSTKDVGFKNDIFVADGGTLYLRHRAFNDDLTDTAEKQTHLICSAGFLDNTPQHRTYWNMSTKISGANSGDILVSDGVRYWRVEGFPNGRHSYFDPRSKGYLLSASPVSGKKKSSSKGNAREAKDTEAQKWDAYIPITGKAMAKAGDVLFIAGEPMKLDDPSAKNYTAAYQGGLGGQLLAVSATDGKVMEKYKLEAAPTWDGMAAANGKLFISCQGGTLVCMGHQ